MKKNKFTIFSILSIFVLFLLYNHTLLLNLSTGLTDWMDYPLMVYILEQNIKHLSSFDFANFGNISMYYPSPGGMYLTDLLLPQSIIGLIIFPLTKNYIFTHNIVFFIMALLNIISLHFFWSKVFKRKIIISLLSFLFIFSPYTFLMIYHFQMISYSFFFFSLGILLTAKTNKQYLLAGLFSGLQFLASAYLGIYSITVAAIFYLWQLYKKKSIAKTFKNGVIFLIGFLFIAGYFLFKFVEIKNINNIKTPADMYVNSAMQVTDIFFNQLPSIWTKKVYFKINTYNHRMGNEIFSTGFILLSVSLFGLYKTKEVKFSKKEKYIDAFLKIVFLWGIIAAIGPRLTLNGKYLATPLPYILPLKLTPVFDVLRVVSRWFFLIQISILYFVGHAVRFVLKKYSFKKSLWIIFITIILYAIEIFPIEQRKVADTYQSYGYDQIISKCKSADVLLEYPFSPEQPITTIEITLEYWTKILLNQMHYDCQIVNGYSGSQPKHITTFIENFESAVRTEDIEKIEELLKQKNIRFIKINRNFLLPDSIEKLKSIFKREGFEILENDLEYLILETQT